jgi:Cd2+/Zn2+-exporting ATPase
MGAAGSDAALETADVALMGDDLSKIPYAVRLSRAALFTIKTNIAVSVLLKVVFLALAVTGHATLWMAIAADTGASLLVIANGLRLLRTT